ncbi:TIGR03915 family putative DNA repair protein [Christensenellaceae bacterium OttesenSCG-928-K19]|nr:TIGR03915 family putative DNA repair protein [Christensenellaceae bacterium OttesenSCG-928-K19]
MPDGTDIIYYYDGSFEGLMCCVFESFIKGELPVEIVGPGEHQVSLFAQREIVTDIEQARRVIAGIGNKIGGEALQFIQRSFLTCLPGKERSILLFLRKGFRVGQRIMRMPTDDAVNTLFNAVRHLSNEVHLLSGFVRFSIHQDVMAAEITPKNYVLPLLAPHFVDRYPNERWLIHDKTNSVVVLYEQGKTQLLEVEEFTLPAPDEEEVKFRELWKLFYDTIAIEGRYNPKCRMTHMPKRYWENMTEFQPGGKAGAENEKPRETAAMRVLPEAKRLVK